MSQKKFNKDLLDTCYKKSIKLLKKNSTEFGVLASSQQLKAQERNYLSIFARDAGICSLGMVASGDKKLIAHARYSLETLLKAQARDGEIPNYVKPEIQYKDFWRMECIDATLWCLIAIKFFDTYSGQKIKLEKKYKKHIIKALYWIKCQKHEQDKLLMQNEASDWADLMPRSGKVLYSNALWYQVCHLYDLDIKSQVKRNLNNLFFPFGLDEKKVLKCDRATVRAINRLKPKTYYLSFVNYLFWGRDIDVYGNSLAIIFKLASRKRSREIIEFLDSRKRNKDLSMPVLFNPIKNNSRFWREYMESHSQNYPFQYHNGGVWPFASCFWVIALWQSGFREQAWQELEKVAQLLKHNDWSFHEWFQAQNGRAHGMHGQSWNAGAFLLAYNILQKNIKI
jgi:glycogen debranching enzyme